MAIAEEVLAPLYSKKQSGYLSVAWHGMTTEDCKNQFGLDPINCFIQNNHCKTVENAATVTRRTTIINGTQKTTPFRSITLSST
mmetsp:Transcript_3484/g.9754  ORF Transcript_3484/g.9754 Transcript_3484/m.9754 type:complete len:84 (+) Transcript_3484:2314-2565(+)